MDTQDYLEISIPISSEEKAEIIEAIVSDLGFDSFMYERQVLKCYIQASLFDGDALHDTLKELSRTMAERLDFSVEKMPAVNWNAEWEQNGFTPIVVGDVTVHPVGTEAGTPVSIVLDPQMAFGTGHHDTTYMMMQTMVSLSQELQGATVVDLGCGTAVLAILAAKLGAGKVSGIDIDATAARSAEENVRLNGLDFPVFCGDASLLETDAYDFILANIHRNIIISDMAIYARSLKKGGKLLLSGFYVSDIPDITEAAKGQGLSVCEPQRQSGDWACLQLRKH